MIFQLNNTRPVMQRQLDATKIQQQMMENSLAGAEAAQQTYNQLWPKRTRTNPFGIFMTELAESPQEI